MSRRLSDNGPTGVWLENNSDINNINHRVPSCPHVLGNFKILPETDNELTQRPNWHDFFLRARGRYYSLLLLLLQDEGPVGTHGTRCKNTEKNRARPCPDLGAWGWDTMGHACVSA